LLFAASLLAAPGAAFGATACTGLGCFGFVFCGAFVFGFGPAFGFGFGAVFGFVWPGAVALRPFADFAAAA
jgi:hypothetical protein